MSPYVIPSLFTNQFCTVKRINKLAGCLNYVIWINKLIKEEITNRIHKTVERPIIMKKT